MRESVSRRLLIVEPLLDLDHLVQAALPRTIGHHPAGVFVDDLHLVVGTRCSADRAGTGAAPTAPVRRVPRARAQWSTAPRQTRGELGDRGATGVGQFDTALAGPQAR
jgi:hypothetical protein